MKRNLLLVVCALSLGMLMSNRLLSQIIYVIPTGAGDQSGSSWANAAPGGQLQSLIGGAAAGSQIWVAAGTYMPNPSGSSRDISFQLKNGVALYGGFAGTETVLGRRNVKGNPTILSGDIGTPGDNSDNCYHVVTSGSNDNTAVLDGFTVTGGNANVGATDDTEGGGLYLSGSSATINSCSFISNAASMYGGGVIVGGASPKLTNCVFINNTSRFDGGAMCFLGGTPLIANCIFLSNTASFGQAMYCETSTPVITDCTFFGAGAFINGLSSTPVLTNCILSGAQPISGSAQVTYSLVQGGYTGTGNVNADPLFVNGADPDGPDNILGTADDGLRLQQGSPAMDKGSNAAVPAGLTTDIIGASRIQATVDMGAYEDYSCPSSHLLYVNNAVSADGDGSSWGSAYKELRTALKLAQHCSNIDSILVAAGTYLPTDDGNKDSAFAILRGGLKVIGGYNAATGERNVTGSPTVLSGLMLNASDVYHVMIIAGLGSDADSVVVDGFTVTAGNAGGSNKTYNGVVVPGNSGGGLCLQSNNGAGGRIAIRNCRFTNNTASSYGGGLYNQLSSPFLSNCVFYNNTSSKGGGICNANSSSPVIVSCLFLSNQGTGLYNLTASNATIVNSSFSANRGAMSNDNSSPVVTNCILWGNTGGNAGIQNLNGAAPVVSYSDVQGTGVYAGTGNLNADPLFVSSPAPAGADNIYGTADDGLKLQAGSPALDMGSEAAVPAGVSSDLTGAARIQGVGVDMGAYEGFTCPSATTLYVNNAAAVSGDGSSWSSPVRELRDALRVAGACSSVNKILVAAGTYLPAGNGDRDEAFAITRGGLKVFGGYNAGTGIRDIDANPTILSGNIGDPANTNDNSYHVVVIEGVLPSTDSTVIDGFIIRDGNAGGAGSRVYNGVSVWQNAGGGICLESNELAGTSVAILNCRLLNNNALQDGGGLYNHLSNPFILNCVFYNNKALEGSGIFNYEHSSPTIANCVFQGNTATSGAIGNRMISLPSIFNCTFSGNQQGIYNDNVSPTITNCILWDNSGQAEIQNVNGATPVVSYSDVRGSGVYAGAGNINADPLFVNPSVPAGPDNIFGTKDDGLQLQAESPAMDKGNKTAIPHTVTMDLTGAPRIQGLGGDMGAYERFSCPSSTSLYVNNAVAVSGDGSSWGSAIKELRDALLLAHECGSVDSILVAAGTYLPMDVGTVDSAFAITRGGLKLIGGYNASTGARDITANPTVLSGYLNSLAQTYHVMVITGLGSSADSVVVDGFTIRDGFASYSGSKDYHGVSVSDNNGAGIYLVGNNGAGGRVAIRNCQFLNNSVFGYGGALYNESSSPSISSCVFYNNSSAIGYGSGICNYNASSPAIVNCIFAGNHAISGAVMNRAASYASILNCTFAGNQQGIYNDNSSPVITNCILWDNSDQAEIQNLNGAAPVVTYSDVQGTGVYAGTGNLNVDPLFVSSSVPAGADNTYGTADDGLTLQSCSPVINTGNTAAITAGLTADITGSPRLFTATVDMGSYEYQSVPDGSALAVNGDNIIATIQPGDNALLVPGCRIIGRVQPDGTSPVSGLLQAQIWVESDNIRYQGNIYLGRHFGLLPAVNPGAVTARITLYALQSEFDAFNGVSPVRLPTGAGDAAGIGNLRIFRYSGVSGDGSGAPGSYGPVQEIDPNVSDIVWNSALARWAVSFDAPVFSGFFIGASATSLPLTLLRFSGKVVGDRQVQLGWTTTDEVNTASFGIQRSTDTTDFVTVGSIPAEGAGGLQKNYGYTDGPLPAGNYLYRLLMTDRDGKYTYSPVISLQLEAGQALTVYPVPARDAVWLGGPSLLNTIVDLFDLRGKLLRRILVTSWPQRIDLGGLSSGLYVLQIMGRPAIKITKE